MPGPDVFAAVAEAFGSTAEAGQLAVLLFIAWRVARLGAMVEGVMRRIKAIEQWAATRGHVIYEQEGGSK